MAGDAITLKRIQLLHPALRDEVSELYAEIEERLTSRSSCRFTHTLRTFKEQDELYAIGRTKPGRIVTNAKGGKSWHNYGMAIDIVLLIGGGVSWDISKDFDGDGKADWAEVVQVFKEFGWEAGIDWKFRDAPHFQKTLGLTINEMHKRYLAGKRDANGYVII
jgi:peptidoglycan L-alanyl-D-glutamate endopeptidase CwlK